MVTDPRSSDVFAASAAFARRASAMLAVTAFIFFLFALKSGCGADFTTETGLIVRGCTGMLVGWNNVADPRHSAPVTALNAGVYAGGTEAGEYFPGATPALPPSDAKPSPERLLELKRKYEERMKKLAEREKSSHPLPSESESGYADEQQGNQDHDPATPALPDELPQALLQQDHDPAEATDESEKKGPPSPLMRPKQQETEIAANTPNPFLQAKEEGASSPDSNKNRKNEPSPFAGDSSAFAPPAFVALQEKIKAETARKEAEAKIKEEAAQKEAEAKIKEEAAQKEAEAKIKEEAAQKEAEAKIKEEAAQKEAEAKIKEEAAKKEAEAKIKEEAAKKEAEAKIKEEAAKKEAEAKIKEEAAKKEAEAKIKEEAAKKEAEAKIKEEAAKKEAEAKIKEEAAQKEAEAKIKEEAAKKEAEAKIKEEAAQKEAEAKIKEEAAKKEAEAKIKEEAAKKEAEAKIKEEAAKKEAEAKIKEEAAKKEAEAKIKEEAAKKEAEAKIKEEAAKKEAEAKIKEEAAKKEAEAKIKEEAAKKEAKAKEEAAQNQAKAKAKQEEAERLAAEAKAKEEAEKQEEEITRKLNASVKVTERPLTNESGASAAAAFAKTPAATHQELPEAFRTIAAMNEDKPGYIQSVLTASPAANTETQPAKAAAKRAETTKASGPWPVAHITQPEVLHSSEELPQFKKPSSTARAGSIRMADFAARVMRKAGRSRYFSASALSASATCLKQAGAAAPSDSELAGPDGALSGAAGFCYCPGHGWRLSERAASAAGPELTAGTNVIKICVLGMASAGPESCPKRERCF